jgi:8-oxo-dGTP pyrophosphatase MutT (NUDIX family)
MSFTLAEIPLRFRPNVTVAAVIEQQGLFLLVEEETPQGLRLNNPAGHLEQGESLLQACTRETLEETAYAFDPTVLIGVYLSSSINKAVRSNQKEPPSLSFSPTTTYLRFVFSGKLGALHEGRALDKGIVRTWWLRYEEVLVQTQRLRSPMVLRCMADYLAGRRYPLDLLHTAIETD